MLSARDCVSCYNRGRSQKEEELIGKVAERRTASGKKGNAIAVTSGIRALR